MAKKVEVDSIEIGDPVYDKKNGMFSSDLIVRVSEVEIGKGGIMATKLGEPVVGVDEISKPMIPDALVDKVRDEFQALINE